MKILVLGSGGREHALVWKLAQSKHKPELFVAPGNGGTTKLASNVPLNLSDKEAIGKFCTEQEVNMVVVGPEDPLVEGIVDYFKSTQALSRVMIIGPSAEAAQLEGSKEFAKTFMQKHNIPTAAYQSFKENEVGEACAYLEQLKPPYVLKADGLAAGKGVVILDDLDQAKAEVKVMLGGKFGEASKKLVIEEFLDGPEFSVFALTDGKNYVILPEAKDYKRIGEGDKGLNTGGMGAVSPVPFVDSKIMRKVEEKIVRPTVEGLATENMDYRGFIFFGLILVAGDPMVIEYNVRMGDPETEVVLPRLKSDLVDLLTACFQANLKSSTVEFDDRSACTVMTVSEGYPESYEKGKEISGLGEVRDCLVFHAGTRGEQNKVVTNGGRVLAFTAFGQNHKDALSKSYQGIKSICFDGITFRRDIGFDL